MAALRTTDDLVAVVGPRGGVPTHCRYGGSSWSMCGGRGPGGQSERAGGGREYDERPAPANREDTPSRENSTHREGAQGVDVLNSLARPATTPTPGRDALTALVADAQTAGVSSAPRSARGTLGLPCSAPRSPGVQRVPGRQLQYADSPSEGPAARPGRLLGGLSHRGASAHLRIPQCQAWVRSTSVTRRSDRAVGLHYDTVLGYCETRSYST